jgi:hypothetical protein
VCVGGRKSVVEENVSLSMGGEMCVCVCVYVRSLQEAVITKK